MGRWKPGEADIEALLTSGELQQLSGGAADGTPLLVKAVITLETARAVLDRDPDSTFILAYDAARCAGTALLAHQGLRPTSKGGHYALERALKSQFGQGFREFGNLRRRRNELEYPERPGDTSTLDEAHDSIQAAAAILAASQQLIGSLSLFGPSSTMGSRPHNRHT